MKEVALCVNCRPNVPKKAITHNILSGLSATGETLESQLILTSIFSKKIGDYTDTTSILESVSNFLRQIDRTCPDWVEDWDAVFGLWSPEERKYQEVPFQSIAQIKSQI